MTALIAGTGNVLFHKKSAKTNAFICENRKNLLIAGGSAPRPPVAVVHAEDHRYEKIFRLE